MIQTIFKLWLKLGYAALMVGAKKGAKANNWRKGLKYMFNLYFFFLSVAIYANIFIAIFPFKGFYEVLFILLFPLNAIYIYGFNKTYDKMLDKLNYDPSMAYEKNTRLEIIAFILFVFSKVIIIPLFVFSFVIQNYI